MRVRVRCGKILPAVYPYGTLATRLGIYMLLDMIEKLKDWGETTYLPYALSKL
jgi:hypothetical protein